MNSDQFVDSVYDEISDLFEKDNNIKKNNLGNNPIVKIFDIYSDWIANNMGVSPTVAANAIYKDVKNVGYLNFEGRKLKRGVQLKGELGFNQIYGTQKEIDQATTLLTDLKQKNPKKYELVVTALDKIKSIANTIKPEKNIFGGKTTNIAKQYVSAQHQMPRYGTLQTLLKLNEKQLGDYIRKFNKVVG